jgi:hypothetical protein
MADKAERTAMLVKAYYSLDEFAEQANLVPAPDEDRIDYRAVGIMVLNYKGVEWDQFHGHFDIDLETGRKLVPLLRDLIREELAALGVTVT